MFGDIPQNILGHFPECLTTFHGMFVNITGMFAIIPRNVCQHSPECLARLPRMFGDIPQNFWGSSLECLAIFLGTFGNIPRNITFPLFPAFPGVCSPFLYSWFYTQPVCTLISKEIKNIRHFLLLKAHPLPQSHKHFSVMGNYNSPRQCSRSNLGINRDNLDRWSYLERVMVVNFLIYEK